MNLESLPPYPTPDYRTRWREAARGVLLVSTLIVIFVSSTTSVVSVASINLTFTGTCIALIWCEALAAVICLVGINFGDPGVIKRTEENCFPLPEDVARRLATGEPAISMLHDNISEKTADGAIRIFCVRCFVWRPLPPAPGAHRVHHCRICQRCVVAFDHHCGVLGRCIAGSGRRGNMKYFKGLIACGQLGLWTCGIACFVAVQKRWGWKGVGIGVACAVPSFWFVGPYLICCEKLVFVGIIRRKLARMQRAASAGDQTVEQHGTEVVMNIPPG